MDKSYWTAFWRNQGDKSIGADAQSQVLRTFAKQPIDEQRWNLTLSMVREQMELKGGGHRMLDLCCGNGLFARDFSAACDQLLAVDISRGLLQSLDELSLDGVHTLESDMREVDFAPGAFDRILFYAAVQHLEPAEVIILFERMAVWLEPGGILYVGDVPNRAKLWDFYNDEGRQVEYFRNERDGRPTIGTWFEPEWMRRLGLFAGFSDVRIVEQPEYMIYHNFRFEMVLIR